MLKVNYIFYCCIFLALFACKKEQNKKVIPKVCYQNNTFELTVNDSIDIKQSNANSYDSILTLTNKRAAFIYHLLSNEFDFEMKFSEIPSHVELEFQNPELYNLKLEEYFENLSYFDEHNFKFFFHHKSLNVEFDADDLVNKEISINYQDGGVCDYMVFEFNFELEKDTLSYNLTGNSKISFLLDDD